MRNARAVGLENSATILCNELDAAKLHIQLHQRSFERFIKNTPSQLLLNDGIDEDEDDVDDEMNGADDAGSLFEIGEDGMVL